jgi:hypothetical protein
MFNFKEFPENFFKLKSSKIPFVQMDVFVRLLKWNSVISNSVNLTELGKQNKKNGVL